MEWRACYLMAISLLMVAHTCSIAIATGAVTSAAPEPGDVAAAVDATTVAVEVTAAVDVTTVVKAAALA